MAGLDLSDIQATPSALSSRVQLPDGRRVQLRLLRAADVDLLGSYFVGLSAATRRMYAPHAFDRATAAQLCAGIDVTQNLRFVAVQGSGQEQAIVAYIIIRLTAGASEVARFAACGIELAPAETCCLAPSVADAYQSRGVGSALMVPVMGWVQQLGYTRMVLSGGVRAENGRAKRFYTKLGFRHVGDFVTQGDVGNHDMVLDLT